jgi:hypothetical protein
MSRQTRSRKSASSSQLTRLTAGAIALTGLAGLAIQFEASLGQTGSVGAALWGMLRYFTIIGNVLATLVMAGLAFNLRAAARPQIVGGITLFMLLIGIVYATLLKGMLDLSGGARLADFLLHSVLPAIVTLHWLLFARKGGLESHDVLGWVVIPIAYFAYAIGRAAMDSRYPYPFMNVAKLGWGQTLINVGAIAAGFLLGGAILYWIDQMLGRLSKGGARR